MLRFPRRHQRCTYLSPPQSQAFLAHARHCSCGWRASSCAGPQPCLCMHLSIQDNISSYHDHGTCWGSNIIDIHNRRRHFELRKGVRRKNLVGVLLNFVRVVDNLRGFDPKSTHESISHFDHTVKWLSHNQFGGISLPYKQTSGGVAESGR